MMDISCNADESVCGIVGGYSNTPFSVYTSTDGFKTNSVADMKNRSMMIIAMATNGKGQGATGGMGAGFGTSSSIETADALVGPWLFSNYADHLSVGQDMKVVRDNGAEIGFAMAGSTQMPEGEVEGVIISTHGKDYKFVPWSSSLQSVTGIRYGSYPSANTWFASGCHWPDKAHHAKFEAMGNCARLAENLCAPVPGATNKASLRHFNERPQRRAQRGPKSAKWSSDYYGVLTKTTNAGESWKVIFESTGKFYFNDIACFNENRCVAVAEGPKGSYIYLIDGDVATEVMADEAHPQYSSLFRVAIASDNEVWVGGGFNDQGKVNGAFYKSTDAGKTFVLQDQVPGVGVITGIHFTNPNKAYAVGVTTAQTSTVMRYE